MRLVDLIHGKNPDDTIIDFLRFVVGELNLKKLPSIHLIKKHIHSSKANSFAAYSPNDKEIQLFVRNRHILDVLRSLAHELVHFKQDIEGRLKPNSGKTGSKEENEANAIAGKLMRIYGKKHKNLFTY